MQGPSKEGNAAKTGPSAAPSQEGPAAGPVSIRGRRGPKWPRLRSRMLWFTAHIAFNSSRVMDEEDGARSGGDTKTTASVLRVGAHRDTCGRPRSGVPGVRLLANHRASLDGRQRESQFSHVLQRMKGVLMRMEHLLAATAAHALLPVR